MEETGWVEETGWRGGDGLAWRRRVGMEDTGWRGGWVWSGHCSAPVLSGDTTFFFPLYVFDITCTFHLQTVCNLVCFCFVLFRF